MKIKKFESYNNDESIETIIQKCFYVTSSLMPDDDYSKNLINQSHFMRDYIAEDLPEYTNYRDLKLEPNLKIADKDVQIIKSIYQEIKKNMIVDIDILDDLLIEFHDNNSILYTSISFSFPKHTVEVEIPDAPENINQYVTYFTCFLNLQKSISKHGLKLLPHKDYTKFYISKI